MTTVAHSCVCRHTVCNPPAHVNRAQFLLDVQYYSGMPDQLSTLDADGLGQTRLK